ncbi:helix-turn-helix domain-containing protein [Salinigranum rubrum]|uniref:Helix-turn-helix domain-containing protein n=1 Tax=Salinigranum rubrum TaxID=755307 RepID=A0A2I8VEC8_9EURY|nr:helix-turn-helix domain-containing protein [Salinigranum rubrum]AUV80282.1 helix-turn-helix domain-containing protein [Salinigranum rubrum]
MALTKLVVDLPPGTWIGEVSSAYPASVFRVLAALPADDRGVGLLEITSEEMRAVLTAIEEHAGIDDVELLQAGQNEALVQFETTQPFLLMAVRNSMVPLELPLDIVGGQAELELTAAQSRLAELTTQLEEFGMSYEVEYLRQSPTSSELLTTRQRDLLDRAVEHGYYDTPRGCTLTELAEELDLAKSTLSERLHRIEGTVLKEFAGSAAEVESR